MNRLEYYNKFKDLVQSYPIEKTEDYNSYYYKYNHTLRVIEYSDQICESCTLAQDEKDLAYLIALFHDIGRFEQIRVKNLCDDFKTKYNHAIESVNMIREYQLLDQLSQQEQTIIQKAIESHNAYQIDDMTQQERLFAKIIRDADKLDILNTQWRVPPKDIRVTNELLQEFLSGQMCHIKWVNTPMDEFLQNVSLIYDLNFPYSYRSVSESEVIQLKLDYLEQIKIKTNIKERLCKVC